MGFFKRFFKGVLATATLLASMTLASGQTGPSPSVRFLETDQVLPAGLWQINLNGDVFTISKNIDAGNNFATATTAITIAANGDVTVPQDFFVTGSATVTVNTAVEGLLSLGGTLTTPADVLDLQAATLTGDGTRDSNFILLTNQGFAESTLNERDWRVYAESLGGSLGQLRVDSQLDSGGYVEYFTLNTSVIMTLGVGINGQALGTTGIFLDQLDLVGAGTQDSRSYNWTATAFDSGPHDADWKVFVDQINNSGLNSFLTWQTRVDAVAFATVMTLGTGGDLNVSTVNASGATLQGNLIIDATGNEVFIVRQDADAADVFAINTTDQLVTIGNPAIDDAQLIFDSSKAIVTTGVGIWSDVATRTSTNYSIKFEGDEGLVLKLNAADSIWGQIGDVEYWQTDATGVNTRFRRPLFVDGRIDAVQFTIDGNATQTNPIALIRTDAIETLWQFDLTPQDELARDFIGTSYLTTSNIEAIDMNIVGAENFTDPTDPSTVNWDVTNDVTQGTGDATYLHGIGSGTLQQTSGNRAIPALASKLYELTYTLTAVTEVGANVMTIQAPGFPTATVTIPDTAGTHQVYFRAINGAASSLFTIVGTSTTAGDGWTIDNLTLKTVDGGDITLNNRLAWGNDLFLHRDGPWELGLRDGGFDNAFYVYGFFQDENNYERAAMYSGGGGIVTFEAQTAGTGQDQQDLDIIAKSSIDLIPNDRDSPGNEYRFFSTSMAVVPDNTISSSGWSTITLGTQLSVNKRTTPDIALLVDAPDLASPGQRDSSWIYLTGQSNDGSNNDSDWKQFVDVTSNAGVSQWTLQERIDAAAFENILIVSDAAPLGSGIGRETMSTSFVQAGNFDAFDSSIQAAESLTDPNDPTSANWSVVGDFADGTLESVYTHSTGTGTLTQALANVAIAVNNRRWYQFTYTVSNVTEVGTTTAQLEGTWGSGAVVLDVSSAGTRTVRFRSNAVTPQNFDISGFSDTPGDTFTLDTFLLREITGGDVNVNNAVAWGTDTFLIRDEPWVLAIRDGNFDSELRLYNQFTDLLNYERLSFYTGGTPGTGTIEMETAGSGDPTQNLDIKAKGTIQFFPNNTAAPSTRVSVTASQLGFNLDNTIDIGSLGGIRPRSIFVATNMFVGLATDTPGDGIVFDTTNLSGAGQRDSHAILFTGKGFDASNHNVDWKMFVDVTSNAGASTFRIQEDIDSAGKTDVLSMNGAGTQFEFHDNFLFNTTILSEPGIWLGATTEAAGNYSFSSNGTNATRMNTPTGGTLSFRVNNADIMSANATTFNIGVTGLITSGATSMNVTGAGPFTFGGSAEDANIFTVGGNYTSDGGIVEAAIFNVSAIINGANGDTNTLAQYSNFGSQVRTQAATENVQDVTSMNLNEPTIVDNLTGGGLIINAATLMVNAAPTEASGAGSINAAILIGAGGDGRSESQVGTYDAIVIDQRDRTTNGLDDSGALIFTGVSHDGSAHDTDWKFFVDVTNNAGDSLFTWQERIDAGGFVTNLTLTGSGNLSLPVASSSIAISSQPADTGAVRLTNNEAIVWRNAANSGNVTAFLVDAGDETIVNADTGDAIHLQVALSDTATVDNNALIFATGKDLHWATDQDGTIGGSQTTLRPSAIYAGGIITGVPAGTITVPTLIEKVNFVNGNVEVFSDGAIGSESITDGGMPNSTNWAGADDWSDTIAGTTTYTHSAGNGTLTQTNAQMAIVGENNRWYQLTYVVSAVTDTGAATTLQLTTAFGDFAVTLDVSSAATRTAHFPSDSAASAADFVLSAVSDTAGDTFTLDDLSLRELTGGNLLLGGELTGGGTTGLKVNGNGGIHFTAEGDGSQSTDINTAVTANGASGTITTQTATTGIGSSDSFVVTNDRMRGVDDVVLVSVQSYSGTLETNGLPVVSVSTTTATTFTVTIMNVDGTNALNGTFLINYAIINTGTN